jgi:hypothetical protein
MFGRKKIKITVYWVEFRVQLKTGSTGGMIDEPTKGFFNNFADAKKAGDAFNIKISEQIENECKTVVVGDVIFKTEDFVWAGYDIEEDNDHV